MDNVVQPIDKSWVKKIKAQKTLPVLACVLAFVVGIVLAIVGTMSIPEGGEMVIHPLTIVGIILIPVGLVMFIICLAGCKVRTKEYNGYTMAVYNGFGTRFYIEGKLAGKGRYATGTLPDGTKVCTGTDAWVGVTHICLGESWDKRGQEL